MSAVQIWICKALAEVPTKVFTLRFCLRALKNSSICQRCLAAMHVLRLLHEGIEFVSRGWVTLPRPEPEKSKLLAVRRGEWSEDRVIAESNRLFAELDAAVEHSPLPERVDLQAVGRLVTQISLAAWERWGWRTAAP